MKRSLALLSFVICILTGCGNLSLYNEMTPTSADNQSIGNLLTPSVPTNTNESILSPHSPSFQSEINISNQFGIVLNDGLYGELINRVFDTSSIRIYHSADKYSDNIKIDANSRIEYIESSPNASYIAFQQTSDISSDIFVIDANRSTIFQIHGGSRDTPLFIGWLDNERIIVELISSLKTPYTIKIINIISKEEKLLNPNDYPDIYHEGHSGKSDWHNYSLAETLYSPDLKYVVYPSTINKYGGINVDLWDRSNLRNILRMEVPTPSANEPVWSPKSDRFLIENDGLLSVTVDGEFQTLITLNMIPGYERIYHYRWSPDGKMIAMWLMDAKKGKGALATFVTENNNLVVYDIYQNEIKTPPFWSPDGRLLLVNGNQIGKAETPSEILVLDVYSNNYYKIPEKSSAAGWVLLDN